MNDLTKLADLIKQRNQIAAEIAGVIGRPAQIGHVGEYIAAQIFEIELNESASQKSIDGYFTTGALKGRSVNVKWHAKGEGLMNITPDSLPDFYLVMTGPETAAESSRGKTRPWLITSVYLFDAVELVNALRARKPDIKIGVATSVRKAYWEAAEIYPTQQNKALLVSDAQRNLLKLFG